MQASDALSSAGEPWRADGRGPHSSAMPTAGFSVISPASSAYGFGGQSESSPSLSQTAGGEDEAEAEAAKRRTNPLIDLIESEKRYVDELGMVIRVSCLNAEKRSVGLCAARASLD